MFIDVSKGTMAQAYSQLQHRNSFVMVNGSYHRILDIVGEQNSFAVETLDEFGRRNHYVFPGHTTVEFH